MLTLGIVFQHATLPNNKTNNGTQNNFKQDPKGFVSKQRVNLLKKDRNMTVPM